MKHLLLTPCLIVTLFCACDNNTEPLCPSLETFGPEVLRPSSADNIHYFEDLVLGPGNNIVGVGRTSDERAVLSQLTENGDFTWSTVLPREDYEVTMLLPISSGGYLVVGRNQRFATSPRFVITRAEADGNILWTEEYGENGFENPAGAAETSEGKFILFGVTDDPDPDALFLEKHFRFIRINEMGTQELFLEIDLSIQDNAVAFIRPATVEEKYWALATTTSQTNEIVAEDLTFLEFTAEGSLTSQRRLAATNLSLWKPGLLNPTTDGGAILTAPILEGSPDNSESALLLLKLAPDGTTEWEQKFTQVDGQPESVIPTNDGGFTVYGRRSSTGQNAPSVLYLLHTNSSGEIQWCREFTMTDFGLAGDLVQLPDNRYFVNGGQLLSSNNSDFQLWTLTLNALGIPQ